MAGLFLLAFCFEVNAKETIKSSLSHTSQEAGKPFPRPPETRFIKAIKYPPKFAEK
jgi:hypothetical protein